MAENDVQMWFAVVAFKCSIYIVWDRYACRHSDPKR